jgi:flagellin-like hook-associated protein FlgL
MSEITLTASQRQTLLSLQQVTQLQNQTNERLNTGKKVNSAADNAVAYFQSQNLSDRANNFTTYKTNIDQSVQSLNAALTATSSVETLLEDLKGVVTNAASNSTSENASATTQFNSISKQLFQLVSDSTYQGLNILTSSSATLTTQVSDRTASTFTVNGYNLQSNGTQRSLFTQSTAFFTSGGNGSVTYANILTGQGTGETTVTSGFSQLNSLTATQTTDIVAAATKLLDNAISQVQAITAALGANVNILQNGSDALTLADLNTEAANSTALSLRQQLGIQSLTTSATQNSSVLSLLRSG